MVALRIPGVEAPVAHPVNFGPQAVTDGDTLTGLDSSAPLRVTAAQADTATGLDSSASPRVTAQTDTASGLDAEASPRVNEIDTASGQDDEAPPGISQDDVLFSFDGGEDVIADRPPGGAGVDTGSGAEAGIVGLQDDDDGSGTDGDGSAVSFLPTVYVTDGDVSRLPGQLRFAVPAGWRLDDAGSVLAYTADDDSGDGTDDGLVSVADGDQGFSDDEESL